MKRNVQKEKDHTIRRLVHECKPIRWWLALGALISTAAIICAIAGPKLLGGLVDRLYEYWSGNAAQNLQQALVTDLLILLAVYFGYSLMNYFKMLLLNNVVSRYFTCGLRIKISEKIKRLPVSYVDQTPVGDILNRMTEDVSTMGNYIHQIVDILTTGVLQIIAITVMMMRENWLLAILVLALTPFSIWLSTKISAKSENGFHNMFEEGGNLSSIVEESYSNFATTKAYNYEQASQEKHDKVNERRVKAEVNAVYLESVLQPIIAFSNHLAYIAISLIGGWLLVSGHVTSVGIIVSIVLYARQFSTPLEQIASGLGQLQHAKSACRRVFKILDLEEEHNPSGEMDTASARGDIQFAHVDFSYSKDTPLIQNLNIDVKQGQSVAIVGPTGAGKTTIVNLLMRFYDIDAGKITIDGKDLSNLSRESTRDLFGMVLQDTWLFHGTIAENVAYGKPDATREEIIDACDKAYCDHFIRTLPEGYDTVIGDDTTNISGGQKQLLTIARAILAGRKLLILDEATSNVDTRTEILIQKAMDNLMKGKTCFVIAHRLSTIVDSDLILVLNDGKIVEQGKHEQLLAKRGFYYQIYTSQYAI